MRERRTILARLFTLLLVLSFHRAEAYRRPVKGPVKPPVKTEVPALDPGAINMPNQPESSPGDKGPAVLRGQILLARAHFSCGEIDGYFGSNLQKALSAFQAERKLPQSGKLDGATWAALNTDTAPVLVTYTIAAEDVTGPFEPLPKTIKEQAKLPALGYSSPLEALAERFHSSPALLRALNPGEDFRVAGQQMMAPNVITLPPGRAANIVVSKSESSVRAYDADGHLLAFYPATAGSTHDPLPIGNWKVTGSRRNPEFHYNPKFFWDAKDGDQKAVLKPGPNNPVGLVWINLSKEHTGIHGTPEPSRVGHTYSHGCIRLTNWDALELAAMVRPGLPAILKE